VPSRPPTTVQLQAHRFAVRRLEAALVGRDPTLRRDPGRRQNRALIAGAVVGVLALAGVAVVGAVRGDADWRHETIVRGEPSGALYAVAHGPDRLVPALNLASARLLAAAAGPRTGPASVTAVRDEALADAPRTAPAGIAGAPSVLPDPDAPLADAWTICDEARVDPSVPDPAAAPPRRTVVLGGVVPTGRPLGADEALLVRGAGADGAAVWLVDHDRRSRVDPRVGSVLRGLGLIGSTAVVSPRAGGTAFVDALPEGPPLDPVRVAGSGSVPLDPRVAALGSTVGAVVTPDGARFFLVGATGVQEVPTVIAQLARFADTDPAAEPGIARVPTGLLEGAPRTALVDATAYPAQAPRPVPFEQAPVACVRARADGSAEVDVAATLPSPVAPTPLTTGEGTAVGVIDAAHVAGGGAYVIPVAPGEVPDTASGVVVDPDGRVFGVPDTAAAAALGLGTPRLAPRSVIDLLPRGPALDAQAARVIR
jgi:type VII secretion protein EccB